MCQQFLNTVGETKKKAQSSVTKQITEEKELIYYLKTAVAPTASIWWKFIFTIKGPTVWSSEIRHLPEERKIITIFHIIASAKDMSKKCSPACKYAMIFLLQSNPSIGTNSIRTCYKFPMKVIILKCIFSLIPIFAGNERAHFSTAK